MTISIKWHVIGTYRKSRDQYKFSTILIFHTNKFLKLNYKIFARLDINEKNFEILIWLKENLYFIINLNIYRTTVEVLGTQTHAPLELVNMAIIEFARMEGDADHSVYALCGFMGR